MQEIHQSLILFDIMTQKSAVSPRLILQASCGGGQNAAQKAACQSPPRGGGDPGPDRKEAELRAKLPDTHTDTQWAAMTGSRPQGGVSCVNGKAVLL